MKKRNLLLVWLLAATLFLCACTRHDDLEKYIAADSNTVTLKELLTAPYVTEGTWSFVGNEFVYYKGEYVDTDKAEEDMNLLLAERVQEIFEGYTLYAVKVPPGERNYDAYIDKLLGADRETIPLYVYLGAGTPFGMQIHDGDVKPTHISVISLDGVRCYLDISYITEPEHKAVGHVFFTDEPKVIQKMMALGQALIDGVWPDENHGEAIDDSQPDNPQPPVKNRVPLEVPALQVSANPAIQKLVNALNAALAENGHPIVLTIEDPEALIHEGELKLIYNGQGTNPYADLRVSFYQYTQELGKEYGEDFSCNAVNGPTPDARDAARIIFQTAIPLYDSVLHEKYAEAYMTLADGIQMDERRTNIYGVKAGMIYDVLNEYAEIRTSHEIRGLRLWHEEKLPEDGGSVSYSLRRLIALRPVMPGVRRQDMLDMLSEKYSIEGPLNVEPDTEDWIGEYSNAIISHSKYGQINVGFNSRMDNAAIRVTTVSCNTEGSGKKFDWYLDVCSRMLAFCGDQFDIGKQKEIIAAVRKLADGEELEFESESRSMRAQAYRYEHSYTFTIRMEVGQDRLSEEDLAKINTWFAWDGTMDSYPVGNSFLTCIYQQPSEMNMFEVFGGQGGMDNENGQISETERKALINAEDRAAYKDSYAAGYEVQKFKAASMDKLLKQHTGFGLKDQPWNDMEAFTYLQDYDAYYCLYGGTNKGGYTMIEGWYNEDGTLSLVYQKDSAVYETGYDHCVVTLRPAESGEGFHGYWFVSNLPYIG